MSIGEGDRCKCHSQRNRECVMLVMPIQVETQIFVRNMLHRERERERARARNTTGRHKDEFLGSLFVRERCAKKMIWLSILQMLNADFIHLIG